MSNQLDQISKFLSFVLRHKPDAIGLKLDENGWANIDELIEKSSNEETGPELTKGLICRVVENNKKKRFAISEDGRCIRANQGHSIRVNLELQPQLPPEILYHGTASRFLKSILAEGLKAGKRQHVHLSADMETAEEVGKRYGKPVILKINAQVMNEKGYQFFLSENGVWLTDFVPIAFINENTL
ncbi:MAG: RNA 2'-phosphotransferase [Methylocystaceae bacterium]|nr:RNA 2'-phosphotransferase [Methylocystaceae bacterium]